MLYLFPINILISFLYMLSMASPGWLVYPNKKKPPQNTKCVKNSDFVTFLVVIVVFIVHTDYKSSQLE